MRKLIHIDSLSSDCRFFYEHVHSCWEISYYIQGEGINTIGGIEHPFSAGTIICQPPGIAHSERSEHGFRNIFFCIEQMDDFGAEVPVFTDGINCECGQLLRQMLYCYHKRENRWENVIDAGLALFTEYLHVYNGRHCKNPLVEDCEKQIIENISNQDFSLSALIESIPLSSTYFMKLFKKETGLTPADYLTEKRINHAKLLLPNRHVLGYRIKDISLLCGYRDQFYFSRVFKKATGFAPEIMFP